ncbi:unnamed protein product [Lampetra fluviatilis]
MAAPTPARRDVTACFGRPRRQRRRRQERQKRQERPFRRRRWRPPPRAGRRERISEGDMMRPDRVARCQLSTRHRTP